MEVEKTYCQRFWKEIESHFILAGNGEVQLGLEGMVDYILRTGLRQF